MYCLDSTITTANSELVALGKLVFDYVSLINPGEGASCTYNFDDLLANNVLNNTGSFG